jgi:hypothetical protein
MSKRFELWKTHQESVSKFEYYIVALAATLFAYFVSNKGIGSEAGAFSCIEMVSMFTLMISIIAGILTIKQNIKIACFTYQQATLREAQPDLEPDRYNQAVRKTQNWSIGFQWTRDGSLFLSLFLMFLSRTI